jgi:hypothetical protein
MLKELTRTYGYVSRSAWNANLFISLPLERVEIFSENVAHAPYRDETQSNLLLHKKL